MLSKESTVVAVENVLASTVESEVVLLELKNGLYYSLDAVGVDIWHMLDQPIAVTDVILKIQDEYDAPAEQIETDVLLLLQDLEREGLIEASGTSKASAPANNAPTGDQGQPRTLLSRLLKPMRRKQK